MINQSSHRLVYVTTADAEEARNIARAVVEGRLAACANILPGMVPVFRWEGEISEGSECVLILKTVSERLEALVAAIEARHSYDCPCIVALPVAGGSKAFLDWIAQETAEGQGA